jgi:GNAT superfamily N-acetyltransferase
MPDSSAGTRANAAGTQARARSPRLLAGLAMGLSLLATLGVLELGLRLLAGDLAALPDPGAGLRMVGHRYPGSHDPELGFVPTPGAAPDNPWNTTVTITPEGVRSNGASPAPRGIPIVAVGDSFTFGDEVDDDETWPARLEARLGRPVVNGGVFGYGLDQITLRSERLLERFPDADTLIVSLIPDDVRRCEYAYRYAWKPYFEIEDGALALRNVPVPAPHEGPPGEPAWRRALRWSLLADRVMRRIDREDWLLPDSVRAHRQGVDVARLLVDRLAEHARRRGHRLLLMLQWHPAWDGDPALPVLERAAAQGIEVLQLQDALRRDSRSRAIAEDPLFHLTERPDGRYEVGHMTPLGNDVVARLLAERLGEPGRALRGALPAQ